MLFMTTGQLTFKEMSLAQCANISHADMLV